MKKLLSVILVLCMLLSVTAFSANAAYADDFSDSGKAAYQKLKALDADGNGTINTDDAAKYLRAAAGILDEKDADYDYNKDGMVSVEDAQTVLKVVAGIESPFTQEEALVLFNDSINEVKTNRPGFQKVATAQCPSIKITTMNAPIADMNVTNMEFTDYVNKIVKLMNTFPYNMALDENMKAQLKEMQQEAKSAYDLQTETKNIAKTSTAHYSYFPVTNLGWSSKLTIDDIKSISCTLTDSVLVFNIQMSNYTYVGDEYPTGTAGFAARQKLPYGKVFNIPAFDESDGSTVNKVSFKNGKIEYHLDLETGAPVYMVQQYTYITDITAAPQKDSDLVMKTEATTNIKDTYNINKVA